MAYVSSPVPSITTTVFTTSTTLTSYLTITTGGANSPDIVGPIEGLSPCSQAIVFESLANSSCNPSDFLCICNELVALGVAGKVKASCSTADSAQYDAFQATVCANGPFPPPSVIVTPTPVVNATSAPPAVYTPASNGTLTNATTLVPVATTAPPAAMYTGGAEAVKIGVLAGAMGVMGLVFAGL